MPIIGCTTRPYNFISFSDACRHIAAAGYEHVAVFINEGQVPVRAESTPDEVKACRNQANDAGLSPSLLLGISSLGLGLDAAVDNYKRLIDNAALLGSRWLLDCGTEKPEHYADYVELMSRAAPHASDAGVAITFKPHGGISLTGSAMRAVHQKVNHPAFTLCYDPGNILYYTMGAQRPEKDVLDVASQVATFITKDCTVQDGQAEVAVTPGDGLVDFPTVIGKLLNAGFDGPMYLECVSGKTIERINEDVRSSLTFIRDLLDRAAS